MKAVLQRVTSASVAVEGEIVGRIDAGLLVLFCVEAGDQKADAEYFARKIARMRIFSDENGKMNRSVSQVGGRLLVVSQFTLAANWHQGNRPSFTEAASPEYAQEMIVHFLSSLGAEGVEYETGTFGAHMQVSLVNDGPITIPMDSRSRVHV